MNMDVLSRFLWILLSVFAVLVLNWLFIELIISIMNLFDELRLAYFHLKNVESASTSLMEPYRSLLKCCSSIVLTVRTAIGYPSPLPHYDEDFAKGLELFVNEQDGVSSSEIDI